MITINNLIFGRRNSLPIALESFIMNATGVSQIGVDNGGQYKGFVITSSSSYQIDWGDGNIITYSAGTLQERRHVYSIPYTGEIKILSTNLTTITSLDAKFITSVYPSGGTIGTITVSTTELSKLDGLTNLSTLYDSLLVTGDVINLPNSLLYISIQSTNVSGNTSNLPQSLITCSIGGSNTIGGDTTGLPRSVTTLNIAGANTISGNTTGLPRNTTEGLSNLTITGNNTISGDTSGLPRNIYILDISGSNTISGSTSDLPRSTLWGGLFKLIIDGNNTISGDTSGLPPVDAYLDIDGNNTISGDTSGLPALSTTYGSLRIYGNNTISGNVSNLPGTNQVFIYGNNLITGDISGFASTIQAIQLVSDSCSVYGDVATLNQINSFIIKSTGTLSGDLYYLPSGIRLFDLDCYMNFTYTAGRVWTTNFSGLKLTVKGSWSGFNSTQTDNLLIDLYQKYYSGSSNKFIIKCSSNPKRTSVSDTAYAGLVTKISAGSISLL